MQINDSIYPWGEINATHEWHHNDTINTSIVAPVKQETDITIGIGTIEVIIALAIYSAVLGCALFFQNDKI